MDKARVARAFSAGAETYDSAAEIQAAAAARLASRIRHSGAASPRRILEIGCGTGLLSAELARMFPEADLLLTDIAPAMLARCAAKLGPRHRYQQLDGEHPKAAGGPYDLIASSLALQWFTDLRGGLARLSRLLAPGGRLCFATLGQGTFAEWRSACAGLGLRHGTPDYPAEQGFPWPKEGRHEISGETMVQHHASGRAFLHGLKALGAQLPAPGYRPLPAGSFRRLLAGLEAGFPVTYQILYGELHRSPERFIGS